MKNESNLSLKKSDLKKKDYEVFIQDGEALLSHPSFDDNHQPQILKE